MSSKGRCVHFCESDDEKLFTNSFGRMQYKLNTRTSSWVKHLEDEVLPVFMKIAALLLNPSDGRVMPCLAYNL